MLPYFSSKALHSYWILGLVQVLHSIEETVTHLYQEFKVMSEALHHLIAWIPILSISADLFAVANYLLIALMLGLLPIMLKDYPLALTLMWTWGIIEILNGIFHVGTWITLHHYFPGGITGPILLILGVLLVNQLRLHSAQNIQNI